MFKYDLCLKILEHYRIGYCPAQYGQCLVRFRGCFLLHTWVVSGSGGIGRQSVGEPGSFYNGTIGKF